MWEKQSLNCQDTSCKGDSLQLSICQPASWCQMDWVGWISDANTMRLLKSMVSLLLLGWARVFSWVLWGQRFGGSRWRIQFLKPNIESISGFASQESCHLVPQASSLYYSSGVSMSFVRHWVVHKCFSVLLRFFRPIMAISWCFCGITIGSIHGLKQVRQNTHNNWQ